MNKIKSSQFVKFYSIITTIRGIESTLVQKFSNARTINHLLPAMPDLHLHCPLFFSQTAISPFWISVPPTSH